MKNYQKINLWNCLPNAPYSIRIKLTYKFKQRLLGDLPSNKNKTINLLNNTSYARKGNVKASFARWFNWFKYNNINIPLWAAMGFCELTNISLVEMEKNIISYKQKLTPNRVSVKSPILPIEFNPTLVSLASHFCFDGSLPKDGKGAYYSQKNMKQVNNFIDKVKRCFGDTYVTIGRDGKGIPKIRLPRFVGEFCKYICNFDNFGTFDSKIPSNLMKSKEFKLAILISAIVDEGHLQDNYIQFKLSNKKLIKDIEFICHSLSYKCSKINRRERKGYPNSYYFYMKSIKKFYQDYLNFNKKFPLISLTFKTKKLQFFISTANYPKGASTINSAKSRKEIIINCLKKSKTSYEIAEETSINPRSVRRLLFMLLKEGKIKRVKTNHFYYYSL